MSNLAGYVDRQVLVATQDGRIIVGTLKGFDQKANVILAGSTERVYSADEGVEEVPLGLYLVKGDNLALVGELDEEADKAQDLANIMAEPMGIIRH